MGTRQRLITSARGFAILVAAAPGFAVAQSPEAPPNGTPECVGLLGHGSVSSRGRTTSGLARRPDTGGNGSQPPLRTDDGCDVDHRARHRKSPALQSDLWNYDPLSFVTIDYTHAWFEGGDAGDGTTLALAASKSLSDAQQPTFVALWGHFGRANDELTLPDFGGRAVGLRQHWYRGGVMVGIDYSHPWFERAREKTLSSHPAGPRRTGADVDRRRRLYGLLGYEYNDIELTLPDGFRMDRDSRGMLYGAGVLLQYTARSMVDLRVIRVNYEDETARFTTYAARNDYLLGAGVVLATGMSYSASPSADTMALHVGLTWMFE